MLHTTLGGRPRDEFSSRRAGCRVAYAVADTEDREVIAGLARGDTRAFDRAYDRLRAPVYSFLVRLSGRADLAEDLLQETWLRLARSAPALPADTQLRPWLFTVARNLYRSHRRWSGLDFERLRQLAGFSSAASISPFDSLAASSAERTLERALALLPVELREMVLLCSVSGFAPAQAASVLGITPEAARQRLSRARARLRQSLEHQECIAHASEV